MQIFEEAEALTWRILGGMLANPLKRGGPT